MFLDENYKYYVANDFIQTVSKFVQEEDEKKQKELFGKLFNNIMYSNFLMPGIFEEDKDQTIILPSMIEYNGINTIPVFSSYLSLKNASDLFNYKNIIVVDIQDIVNIWQIYQEAYKGCLIAFDPKQFDVIFSESHVSILIEELAKKNLLEQILNN